MPGVMNERSDVIGMLVEATPSRSGRDIAPHLQRLAVYPLQWHIYPSEILPAPAGIQSSVSRLWIPACAGMTLQREARSCSGAQLNG